MDDVQWEYKIIDDQVDGNPDNEWELNNLGLDRWELVAIKSVASGSTRWYFKRPLLAEKCEDDYD